jgi:hypothetical protein
VIHIDEDQGEAGCLVTAVAGHGMMQVIHQQGPVWQLGQRVVQGIELEPPLQLLMMLSCFCNLRLVWRSCWSRWLMDSSELSSSSCCRPS